MKQMKKSWQTLNIQKVTPTFPRPKACGVQMHETLPTNASSGAIRVAMDLGGSRRVWENGDQCHIVQAAAKYTVLFDQYIGWLERAQGTQGTQRTQRTQRRSANPPTFIWRDFENKIVASASPYFEQAMNHFTMGLISTRIGDADAAKQHFEITQNAASNIQVIRGVPNIRYNCVSFGVIADALQRATRIPELTVTDAAGERLTLALELLHEFPDIPRNSTFRNYTDEVKHVLLEHALRAQMEIHCDNDQFADAYTYADILRDEPNKRFFESMSVTARQTLKDTDEWIEGLKPTECIQTTNKDYMGFDSVATLGSPDIQITKIDSPSK